MCSSDLSILGFKEVNKLLWILKYSFIRRARSCKRYSFIFSSFLPFSMSFYCLMHDCVWHDLLCFVPNIIIMIFFNMFLDDCLLWIFVFKFQNLLMTIKDYFFFSHKTDLYFSDIIFFNSKIDLYFSDLIFF